MHFSTYCKPIFMTNSAIIIYVQSLLFPCYFLEYYMYQIFPKGSSFNVLKTRQLFFEKFSRLSHNFLYQFLFFQYRFQYQIQCSKCLCFIHVTFPSSKVQTIIHIKTFSYAQNPKIWTCITPHKRNSVVHEIVDS